VVLAAHVMAPVVAPVKAPLISVEMTRRHWTQDHRGLQMDAENCYTPDTRNFLVFPFAKHSQYFFKHPFVHLQEKEFLRGELYFLDRGSLEGKEGVLEHFVRP